MPLAVRPRFRLGSLLSRPKPTQRPLRRRNELIADLQRSGPLPVCFDVGVVRHRQLSQ